ncbi:cilia- and flagella-associated protein 337-like [Oscarella lobularis]|uniref:cilia- and flagella-associated protein 337-like n=1 Tax=Oscarella lobularis TaxID=121494 RepID=UPI003313C873
MSAVKDARALLASSASSRRTFLTANFTESFKSRPNSTAPSLSKGSRSAIDFDSARRIANPLSHLSTRSTAVAGATKQSTGWEAVAGRPGSSTSGLSSSATNHAKKIEEYLNLEHMQRLRLQFDGADSDGSGTLDMDEFKAVFHSLLGKKSHKITSEEQMTALFMKIDSNSDGHIDWDEFCTYMMLEFREKDDAYARSIQVLFDCPASCIQTPHHEPIMRITSLGENSIVTASQDGTICFWNSNQELKKTFKPELTGRSKSKWITDVIILNNLNKFALSTGDRELQIYEVSSFDPHCQISGLLSVPLRLDFWCNSKSIKECLLSFGDADGCLNCFLFSNLMSCLRLWKKFPKVDRIPNVTLESVITSDDVKFIRWKVHNDWVTELKYFQSLRSIISCSHDSNSALVIGSVEGSTHVETLLRELGQSALRKQAASYSVPKRRYAADQTVFRIYKGVKTFDFSYEHNMLATGGMDRALRLWNPYMPAKPTAMIRQAHNSPIAKLIICTGEGRIYTIATDKSVKVWHMKDHSCLVAIPAKGHRIKGDLQAAYYNPLNRLLAICTDQLAFLYQRGRPAIRDKVLSHRDPVQRVLFNTSFKQVVTACEGSVVKVWDIETGHLVFEFSNVHETDAISDMTFDWSERRLITSGRDGTLRVWNFNNGHCRRIYKKANKKEITSITYMNINRNCHVVAVGWDRRINIFPDVIDDLHFVHYPLKYMPDDIHHGHQEDILVVKFCPPSFLATASFDGEIIIWNMISYHIFSRLTPPAPGKNCATYNPLEGDAAVTQLVYLSSRAGNKTSASLIANGPRGHIHFWCLYEKKVMACFSAGRHNAVSAMTQTQDDSVLFTADRQGFIVLWDIKSYCLLKSASVPPPEILRWRGHVEAITSIEYAKLYNVLLSSARDCCVRMWTLNGHLIGTFGQASLWDIGSSSTYEYPMMPKDVVFEPLTDDDVGSRDPDAEMFDRVAETKSEESSEERDGDEEETNLEFDLEIDDVLSVGTATPAPSSRISKIGFTIHGRDDSGCGKRLRQAKETPKLWSRVTASNHYQVLSTHNLAPEPDISCPNTLTNRTNQFDLEDF